MKALLRILLAALIALGAASAQAQRAFEPAELEALLAPVALYPDPLLSDILSASQYPQDVATAAAWTAANPQLSGDAALATVQGTAWHPSVKALVAYPEVLARMAESPQWLRDLGEAYAAYGMNLMATVQDLRARAEASGYLRSDEQQIVTRQSGVIVVQPAYPSVVYAPYYDPFIVYGGLSWVRYRPVHWRPWVARPRIVTRVVAVPPVRFQHRAFEPRRATAPRTVHVEPYHRVPESRRAPIIHSGGPAFIQSAPKVGGGFKAIDRGQAGRSDGGRRHDGGHRPHDGHAGRR